MMIAFLTSTYGAELSQSHLGGWYQLCDSPTPAAPAPGLAVVPVSGRSTLHATCSFARAFPVHLAQEDGRRQHENKRNLFRPICPTIGKEFR